MFFLLRGFHAVKKTALRLFLSFTIGKTHSVCTQHLSYYIRKSKYQVCAINPRPTVPGRVRLPEKTTEAQRARDFYRKGNRC